MRIASWRLETLVCHAACLSASCLSGCGPLKEGALELGRVSSRLERTGDRHLSASSCHFRARSATGLNAWNVQMLGGLPMRWAQGR